MCVVPGALPPPASRTALLLLGCWVAGLLGCWAVGLLACRATGLLGCWPAGLVGCRAAGRLGCWLPGCWAAGLRAEWFSDPYGVRVDRAGLNSGVTAADRANYFEITAGVNWRPSNNFRLRPEIRYDWNNGMGAANNRYDPAGNVYNHADLWTFGIDGIYLF